MISPCDLTGAPEIFEGRANRITTERLVIAPLKRQEAELYLIEPVEFAKALRLAEVPQEPDDETRAAYNWLIDLSLKFDAESGVWTSIWAIALRQARILVGTLVFKGPPIAGEAELGYLISLPFRRKGYMTESVRAIVRWGRTRSDLKGLVAETLNDNLPSQKVLINAGFQRSQDANPEDDACFWRLNF